MITVEDLGIANRIVIGRDSSIIFRGDNNTGEVSERVKMLNDQMKKTKLKKDKEFISERIATLSGGVGVIYAGGNSDVEQKERYDRIDDAVCAVRSALEGGVIGGGGVSLLRCSSILNNIVMGSNPSMDTLAALHIIKAGIEAPFNQILENSNIDTSIVLDIIKYDGWDDFNYGLNVKTGEYGNLIELGVIDPLKVTKNALKNAVSVAATILSTNAILTLARS